MDFNLGNIIKRLRIEHSITQEELAARLSAEGFVVTQATVFMCLLTTATAIQVFMPICQHVM